MSVYIGRCDGYAEVEDVLRQSIDSLGGLSRYVKKGQRILLKPNLLKGAAPEKAVCTHPEFIIAVARLMEDAGAEVIIADSHGGPSSKKMLHSFYRKAGWLEVEKETGAKLCYDISETRIASPDGRILRSLPVLKITQEVDGIINLPKLKTHGLTVYTGAVKNMYGVVPGLNKAAFHGKYRGIDRFSKVILDIHDAVPPVLSLMDGVLGMGGKGPAGGTPIELDLVLASPDAYELDVAACIAVGIPLDKVPTIRSSKVPPDQIIYTNLLPQDVGINLEYPKGGSTPWWLPEALAGTLSNFYLKRPSLDGSLCTSCGRCAVMCPEDAIKIVDRGPRMSWSKCIRCYCCVEVCPEDALSSP